MRRFALATAVALVTASSASAQVVYTNNFNANTANFGANAAIWSTPGNCIFYCGNYLGLNAPANSYIGGGSGHPFSNSDVATLSLAGLGSHTGGVLVFKLFIIDSWDGNADNCCGPDRVKVRINGNTLFDASFANPEFTAFETQSYPSQYDGSTSNLPGSGALQNGGVGNWYWSGNNFGSGGTATSVYEIFVPFTDGTSSLTIDFLGSTDNQGVADESWGLDDVSVELTGRVVGTPEPGSIALMATGLIGVASVVRRRRRTQA